MDSISPKDDNCCALFVLLAQTACGLHFRPSGLPDRLKEGRAEALRYENELFMAKLAEPIMASIMPT
jgi:hypothetical protein